MFGFRGGFAVSALLMLVGCASQPTGPRMTALPQEARNSILAAEEQLRPVFAECAALRPGASQCRDAALSRHAQSVSTILGRIDRSAEAVLGGGNRDCSGDTRPHCGPHEEVKSMKVNCMYCGPYGHQGSSCFVWVCVPKEGWWPPWPF
jgi:hypothetical protein